MKRLSQPADSDDPRPCDRAGRSDKSSSIDRHGWVCLGRDRLIELLRCGSEIPKEELVWALEYVSGLSLDESSTAWAAWWERLPEANSGLCTQASSQAK